MELQLVLYDTNEIQYTVKPEELRFTKAFYGGIDLEMSYFLPCSLDTDYLYVGYGQRAELWYGLIRLFLAEQREIEEVRRGTTEGITGRCLGYWAFLDDFCYGEKGKIWCDTRYDQWEIAWKAQHTDYRPRHFDFDQTQHLYLAQEAGEANTDNKYGGLFYRCPYDEIKRVTFDYEAGCLDDNKFSQQLISYDIDWGNANTEWSRLNTGSGSEDITLSTARPILVFRVLDTGDPTYWDDDHWMKITNLKLYGSTDTSPTSSDVAADIVSQIQADTPIANDTSLIETISLVLSPLVFEQEESCYDALKTVAFFGDSQHKLFGWGVESGGDRVFIDAPDYDTVRYVIHPDDAAKILRRGTTSEDFMTEGYGKYVDEEGFAQYTSKYYAHVTADGLVANTTSTGSDLASTVYGVKRSGVVDFGPMSSATTSDAIQQYLIEHAHPLITSSISIEHPVVDLHKGGAEIMPFEIEVGHLVQIPWFRAVEAEGSSGSDIRDFSTTFLLAGLEYSHDSGLTRLIPEEDTESLERLLSYTKQMEV